MESMSIQWNLTIVFEKSFISPTLFRVGVGGGYRGRIDTLFLPVVLTQRSSLSVLQINSLPFFPDDLFAADQFYSFEIRFFLPHAHFL